MKISTASINSTKGVPFVIVGTVIAIQEDEWWWYTGCRTCRTKVIKSTDYIDLEYEVSKKPTDGPNDWFHLQIRVQDETGTMSLSLINDEVLAIVGRSAYQLCDKYAKSEFDGLFPSEITSLIGTKYTFKVVIDDYNAKKPLPVFNVLRLSNDPDIINSIISCATPVKDNEASSKTTPDITLLDLESQTDENTTPTNAHKSTATSPDEKEKTNKRKAEGGPGSESTNVKKAVEIKIEKAP
ncbi:replication protein A 70 kDa DNA-binding subunit B [Tanacetum coccineum]|uniref:Replication protein A 70 kDa DNA-binding subunit B n=1 Tax=Tanacetum coccineum TaxID=301880 RepID=A0ABQ5CX07_9ASTR